DMSLKGRVGVFAFENEVGFDGGTILTVTLKYKADSPAARRLLPALTTTASTDPKASAEPQATTELLTILRVTQGMWKAEQRGPIAYWTQRLNDDAWRIYGAIERHAKDEPKPSLVDVFAAQSGRGGPV